MKAVYFLGPAPTSHAKWWQYSSGHASIWAESSAQVMPPSSWNTSVPAACVGWGRQESAAAAAAVGAAQPGARRERGAAHLQGVRLALGVRLPADGRLLVACGGGGRHFTRRSTTPTEQ